MHQTLMRKQSLYPLPAKSGSMDSVQQMALAMLGVFIGTIDNVDSNVPSVRS